MKRKSQATARKRIERATLDDVRAGKGVRRPGRGARTSRGGTRSAAKRASPGR